MDFKLPLILGKKPFYWKSLMVDVDGVLIKDLHKKQQNADGSEYQIFKKKIPYQASLLAC